jgi:hypothetical protein
MIRSRLGLKALVLSGLVLGLMAFAGSSVAQAEPTARWGYINPTTKTLEFFSKTLEASPVIEIENKTASLLFNTKGGTKVAILCTGAEFDEGGQLSSEGSILLGRIKFTGCVTFLNGALSKPCEPKSASGVGTILTDKGTGLITLHTLIIEEEIEKKLVKLEIKDSTVLLKPDEGTRLVKIELGATCAIGEEVPVTGELVIWDCKGNKSFETHAVSHLVEEFPGLHGLVALGQPATLSGSANITLGGVHKGFEWAGLAG